jgi:hypothetical protein
VPDVETANPHTTFGTILFFKRVMAAVEKIVVPVFSEPEKSGLITFDSTNFREAEKRTAEKVLNFRGGGGWHF